MEVVRKFLKRKPGGDGGEQGHNILSRAKRLLTSTFERRSEAFTLQANLPLDKIYASVKKLWDGQKHVGTLVFVGEHVGVTCFHCVVEGKNIKDSMRIDGASLTHIISYPFYDLAFFYCPNSHAYLKLKIDDTIVPGTRVVMASFPDLYSTIQCQDEPDIASGNICRRHNVIPGTVFAGAYYNSFPGASGGAVVDLNANLLGLHTEGVYHEDAYTASGRAGSFLMQSGDLGRGVNTDEEIKYPSLEWPLGMRMSQMPREDTLTLAGYASTNLQHKSAVAAFLPVMYIRGRLENAIKILQEQILVK